MDKIIVRAKHYPDNPPDAFCQTIKDTVEPTLEQMADNLARIATMSGVSIRDIEWQFRSHLKDGTKIIDAED